MNDNNPKLKKVVELINQRGLDGLIIYSRGSGYILKPFKDDELRTVIDIAYEILTKKE